MMTLVPEADIPAWDTYFLHQVIQYNPGIMQEAGTCFYF